jgi:hypothetical protein
MEHLIKRQGSQSSQYFVFGGGYGGGGRKISLKNEKSGQINALTPQFSPLDAQIMLYYIALLLFWDKTTTITFF